MREAEKARQLRFGVMAVPERQEAAEKLQRHVESEGAECLVHYDEPPYGGPWWNWRRTMLAVLQADVEYGVVLQDDVELPAGFVRAVEAVVERAWDEPLMLFTTRRVLLREAARRGTRLFRRIGCDTSQGVVMPAWMARQAIDWIDAHEGTYVAQEGDWSFHSDMRLRSWSMRARRPFVYPFPCLVDHGKMRSTLGHAIRSAAYFEKDVAHVDWSSPLLAEELECIRS